MIRLNSDSIVVQFQEGPKPSPQKDGTTLPQQFNLGIYKGNKRIGETRPKSKDDTERDMARIQFLLSQLAKKL